MLRCWVDTRVSGLNLPSPDARRPWDSSFRESGAYERMRAFHDRGKPAARRGRKATGLPEATPGSRGRIRFPEGRCLENPNLLRDRLTRRPGESGSEAI